MKLKCYLIILCISLSAAAFSQNEKYLVKVTEKPFRFEVFKEGEPKPLLVIDKGITLQHFKNNTIKARQPYFVWTKGKSDKKQVVNRAIETFKSDSLHILVLLNDKNDSLFKFQYKLTDNKLDIKIAEINPPKEDD